MRIRRLDFHVLEPATLAMPALLGFGCILLAVSQLKRLLDGRQPSVGEWVAFCVALLTGMTLTAYWTVPGVKDFHVLLKAFRGCDPLENPARLIGAAAKQAEEFRSYLCHRSGITGGKEISPSELSVLVKKYRKEICENSALLSAGTAFVGEIAREKFAGDWVICRLLFFRKYAAVVVGPEQRRLYPAQVLLWIMGRPEGCLEEYLDGIARDISM
ncbi:MAG: hypothetical protein GY835_09745 [bacterium]|nr:hypothetical protein [bacterium]